MPLSAGSRIGPYEVTAALGSGGMGEVYRARDRKLARDVAIKVLPELLATDVDRLARLQREAQVLASLNHTNIAQIYGIEDSAGTLALVMELVEGPTLAETLSQGAIPQDAALAIARSIADALEAAHERGIIHRDLKPANVKVRPDGVVKVLDFGLAKPPSASPADAMISPTISVHATQAGIILGTAAYMSPEQARGKTVDTRTDVWAFGVVLFEMLAGRHPFGGDDVSDTIAEILKSEPAWNALPAGLPAPLQRLLRRCLQKDPRQRVQHIGDARLDIEDALRAPASSDALTPRVSLRERLAWAAGLVVVGTAAALLVRSSMSSTRARLPCRSSTSRHRPPRLRRRSRSRLTDVRSRSPRWLRTGTRSGSDRSRRDRPVPWRAPMRAGFRSGHPTVESSASSRTPNS